MSESFIGEIRMFGGNFAPLGNAYCAGQLMSIAQYSALYSLIGTTYGGDGVQTFALPDLQGRLPVGMGQGTGLSDYPIGTKTGTETVTLASTQIPSHDHAMVASGAAAGFTMPGGAVPAALASPFSGWYVAAGNVTGSPVAFAPNAVQFAGNTLPHENRMPTLAVSIIIALEGIFPSRN